MNTSRPLKILTLDGGGLQALATLSSLNAVCRAIAKQHGADRPPAPHELFDIIAGVGTGGWIALLLGRYRLDIATCTAIYMELATKVDPDPDNAYPATRKRLFKLDQDRLIKVVEEVLQRYGLDTALLRGENCSTEGRPKFNRCKYAYVLFAAAVVPYEDNQSATYELFRSYHATEFQTDLVLHGPEPADCRMPEVFAATGAAKFFLNPYKIGNTTFFDETFPQSHPISSVALDEAKCLYGREVEISILLNIGPGIPADKDCQELDLMALDPISRLVRRFSWTSGRRLSLRQKLLSIGMPQPTIEKGPGLTSPSEKALRLEGRRREDIRATLEETYGPSGAERYHHLGPAYSAEQASLNDVHALRLPRGDFDDLKKQSIAEAEGMVRKVWFNAAA
ncbi:hypothetical protein G647_01941 [Cladophialophora carrionii CBS 160.54]|uniref:PNPLA domain-containing protein n=1 Tax=Cladophialophora carrionii CBS 160.54 TaxID=1279043 RepID=V9DT39_9EURO|nr:uncharacterized protein G647_01941 [Cladophialophora carrionii CBS 160.54]ETI29488.1 hypothetical protein G647_01941 [Cladophialophora carrionii CBS 160.54]